MKIEVVNSTFCPVDSVYAHQIDAGVRIKAVSPLKQADTIGPFILAMQIILSDKDPLS